MVIAALLIGSVATFAGCWIYLRTRRTKLYVELARCVRDILAADAVEFDCSAHGVPSFGDRIAVMSDFLPRHEFAVLRTTVTRLLTHERSFVPTHKKGGTVAYETLITAAPAVIALYHSASLTEFVSRVVGARVHPTPLRDQSSLSVLFYDRPRDHIGWHFDHNFYRGRHFTVLLAMLNEGHSEGGLSHAILKARAGPREIDVRTSANTLVVFEGASVCHKVTPILDGERRIMLSMTYCTDPRAHWWQGASRRVKDMAFFGLRALWT
jgi:hypothetical protein